MHFSRAFFRKLSIQLVARSTCEIAIIGARTVSHRLLSHRTSSHRQLHTQTPSHKDSFTHRQFHIRTPSHKDTFTCTSFTWLFSHNSETNFNDAENPFFGKNSRYLIINLRLELLTYLSLMDLFINTNMQDNIAKKIDT